MSFRKPFRAVPIKEGKHHRRRRRKAEARRLWASTGKLALAGLGIGIAIGLLVLLWPSGTVHADGSFDCQISQVTDGDTIRCGPKRVRLYGIDAPEMEGHCRPGRNCAPGDPNASKSNLQSLIGPFSDVRCRQMDTDVYGRIVARCTANDVDLSCAQLKSGHAIRKYGDISC